MTERRGFVRGSGVLAVLFWCAANHVAVAQTQDAFFDGAVLQEVRLVMNSRDWQTLKTHFDDNTYYPADVTWNGVTVRNIGVRSRGNATRNPSKPGLRLDINRYVTNQEFLGLKAFSLDNMYSDSSLIRETVTMKMFAKMDLPASREAHARVYVNNEYVGVYVIIEAVDRTFIDRVFGPQEANVESGGYLFEYEWVAPYYLDYLGPELQAYAPLFTPQTRDTDSIVSIYAPLEEMIRTINASTDEDFAAAADKYLDLTLFMKYLAVESFMVEWDGLVGFVGMNNFYLYRFRNGLSQFIPKDKDAALADLTVPITFRFDFNVLVRRAMAVPALREVYLNALRTCAALAGEPATDDPRGWLEREVASESTLVAPAIADDLAYPFSADDVRAAVAALLEFAQLRAPYVNCQVDQMEDGSSDVDPSAACAGIIRGARTAP